MHLIHPSSSFFFPPLLLLGVATIRVSLSSDFSSHFHTERLGSTEREREERSPFCSTLGQKGRRGRGVGAKRGRGIVTSSPSPTTTCLYRHRSLWPFDDTHSHTHGWLHGRIKKESLSFCPLTGFPLISCLLHSTRADSLDVENGERAKVACSAPPTDESRDPFPFSSSSSHPLRAYGPSLPPLLLLYYGGGMSNVATTLRYSSSRDTFLSDRRSISALLKVEEEDEGPLPPL